MSIKKRLSPEESRARALEAARTLLLENGPAAVTLKAVAARVGRTHANLLHHFGSASELQKELAAHMARSVCDTVSQAVKSVRTGLGRPREVVDLTFEAFGREGGGALVSWMLLTGNEDALEPIVETIHAMVDELYPGEQRHGSDNIMHRTTLALVLLAMGDALIGRQLGESLKVERTAARDHAEALVRDALVKAEASKT